jgi:two-component SAPR family response regulator
MNIIAVDDEHLALMDLKATIDESLPDGTLSCFDTPTTAVEYAKDNRIDVAFLDIEMCEMNGLQLAKRLKDIHGKTNIIFVTGYSQYAVDAFALYASGYLMKPVASQSLLEAMDYLRHPVMAKPEKKLHVQTFGNFEVFADGKPIFFDRVKTKELFAYLVFKRGALCNNNEVMAVLWEKNKDSATIKSLFRTMVADLIQTLGAAGIRDVVIKQRGHLAIATESLSCDLYDFCDGIGVNRYLGEFMSQYSWAEFTNSYLERAQK